MNVTSLCAFTIISVLFACSVVKYVVHCHTDIVCLALLSIDRL